MKKSHFILLVISIVLALTSAYSLTAINQVYRLDFEWYSQYKNRFTGEYRETARDRFVLRKNSPEIKCFVAASRREAVLLKSWHSTAAYVADKTDFNEYVLLYCTFGAVGSPEYRIRVIDIAQRGNTVEVRVSVNSPEKLQVQNRFKEDILYKYYMCDMVRIKKSYFTERGKLYFVFKSQDGRRLHEGYYEI